MTPLINGYRKNQKLRLVITLCAFVSALALLLSYVAVYTVSKYRSEIIAYTNFVASPMHAYLLGDMTTPELINAFENKTQDVKLFGTEISLDNVEPGMDPRPLPFAIANATSKELISGIDLDFTLRLRTTGNIPLKYTLYLVDETVESSGLVDEVRSSTILRTFRTGDEYYLENTGDNNAPKYVYPFYEEIDDGSGNMYVDNHEASFVMSGGVLQAKNFILSIEWPVEVNSDADSMKYMKEVDIVDIIANVTSRNKISKYVSSSSNPEFYSTGIIVAYPSAEWGKPQGDGSQLIEFEYDYRAFRILAGSSGIDTKSTYDFRVTNGNNLRKNNSDDRLAEHTTDRTCFKLEFVYPVSTDTIANRSYSVTVDGIFSGSSGFYNPDFYNAAISSDSIFSTSIDSNSINPSSGIMTIKSTSIEYRLYDIRDWSVSQVFSSQEDAIDYLNDDTQIGTAYQSSRYRIYMVVTPIDANGNPYEFELTNKENGQDTVDYLDFTITMTGNPISGETAAENIPKVFATFRYKDNDGTELSQYNVYLEE